MRIRQHLVTALLMTVATTVLLGLVYPVVVTGLAQALFRDQANGQLIERDGRIVGSSIVGQRFTSARYFHGRPSAAGSGYDGTSSGGTNLGPTNRRLIDAVRTAVAEARTDNPAARVPIDLVTTSASGLDPDVSPDAAMFQVPRVARARGITEAELRAFVAARIEGRQVGFLGEPRVNVLLLNLALDQRWPVRR
jgi:K+-transporting ATPase ATPase C chain